MEIGVGDLCPRCMEALLQRGLGLVNRQIFEGVTHEQAHKEAPPYVENICSGCWAGLIAKHRPKQNPNPDFGALQKLCETYLTEVQEKRATDSDTPHYLFEAALSALYGPDVWAWIRKADQK